MNWLASIWLITASMMCGAAGALAVNVLIGTDMSITATALLSGMVGAACCIYDS